MSEEPGPLGPPVEPRDWQAAARKALAGRTVVLEPVDPARHGESLHALSRSDDSLWTYMPYGPFADAAAFLGWLESCAASDDPLFFAIVDTATSQASGMASYLRITPAHGVIEIGHIWLAPVIQRTPQATEAIYLLAREAFDGLGYRRLEWKCNALNEASRRAALRFGFSFEGIFRQHLVVKGRNRDTAWYAILDQDWPRIRANFERWLSPDNFDAQGRQRIALSELNKAR
ncbi:MAG: GNAT family N-acetyltransferase [Kiloniellales bacterium]